MPLGRTIAGIAYGVWDPFWLYLYCIEWLTGVFRVHFGTDMHNLTFFYAY